MKETQSLLNKAVSLMEQGKRATLQLTDPPLKLIIPFLEGCIEIFQSEYSYYT